jgi:GT2 family glycosyltransferase
VSGSRPRVAVVVAVWGGTPRERSFGRLAPTLRSAFYERCERVAIFNGSSTAASQPDTYGLDRYAFLSENAGVARAWNIGSQLSLAEVVCFVNEDVVLEPGSLAPLLEALDRDHGVAAVGPSGAVWDHDRLRHARYVEPPAAGAVGCDAVSGYVLAVRRDAFREVGGFDEGCSPCGGEEVDLCFSLRSAGWRVAAVRCPGVRHTWGVSAQPRRSQIVWFGGRESLLAIDARTQAYLRLKWQGGLGGTRSRAIAASPRLSASGRAWAAVRWLASAITTRIRTSVSQPRESSR